MFPTFTLIETIYTNMFICSFAPDSAHYSQNKEKFIHKKIKNSTLN